MSPALKLGVLCISAFLLTPIIVVVLVSFSAEGSFQFPPSNLSLHWYQQFFSSALYINAFGISLALAVVVGALAALLGGMIAVALLRLNSRRSEYVELFFAAPLLVPSILLGAALLLFYLHTPLRGTFYSLLLGHAVLALPYAVQTSMAGLAGIGLELEEAARSLGASPVQAFLKATLPLVRSSVVSSAVLAFVISFGDVNLAIFLSGPSTATLPMVIFSDILQLGDPTVAAASTIQIAVTGLMLLIARSGLKLRISER